MRKLLLVIIFIFTFASFGGHSVFAQNQNNILKVETQSINPGDDYRYVIKRLQEKISLFFLSLFPQQKADYYLDLVTVRLSELKYVVNKKDEANIQTTSQRYAASSGELTDFILTKNLVNSKKKAIDLMTSHFSILEGLRDTYSYSSSEYRFIQDDINTLKSHITQLSPGK